MIHVGDFYLTQSKNQFFEEATSKPIPIYNLRMAEAKPIITTLVIGADYKKGLQTCLASKRAYAAKHGYSYIEGGEQFWDRKKPIAWSKIPFLLDVCRTAPEGALIWQSDADVLITTPEKWDGISRNWQHRSYVSSVALVIIDEIHLLG
jgi:hypothetical protein